MGDAPPEPAPDPEGVAADILNGEPRAGTSTERTRRFRARQKAQAETETAPAPPAPQLTPTETAAIVEAMWDTALIPVMGRWKDGTPRLKPLTDAQALRLGEVYAPLVAKYLPLIGPWQLELAALIVTVSVVREAHNPKPVEIFTDAPIPVETLASE